MRNCLVMLFLALLITCGSSPGIALVQMKANGEKNLLSGLTATVPAQARLLIEINTAFVHGSISTEQAVNLRQAVDSIGVEEDRYLATGNPIPAGVFRQESSRLDGIRAQLKHYVQSAPVLEFKGSAVLQDQIKSEVDRCLTQGKMPINQGRDLRNKVNAICTKEAWYLSIDSRTIPKNVIQEDVRELNDLDGQLKKNLGGDKTDTL